jgi:hypothetical protein
MPKGSSWPLAGLIAVFAVVSVITGAGCGRDPSGADAEDFLVDSVRTDSADLNVTVQQVRGTVREGYLEWACLLQCQEANGCRADLRVTVHFESHGDPHQIVFTGRMDVDSGARAQLGRVQRPPMRVDAIDRVVIDLLSRRSPGDPPPTPRL